jgi:PAS domain S-box-containing protein
MQSATYRLCLNAVRQTAAYVVTACIRLLYERTLLMLLILLGIGIGSLFGYVAHLQSNLVVSSALRDAALYTQALAEFRTLYTSEVVEALRSRGIEVTHNYKEHAGAIPLPVTLTMRLAERISAHASGAQVRLYSPYPFPSRRAVGGLHDDFSQRAWTFLQQRPSESFHRFETIEGRPSLRYAVADRMRPSCVDCHNTHPDSPKTDWKSGDVRGVLEVDFPLQTVVAQTRTGLGGTLALIGFISLLGLSSVTLVMGRLRRNSAVLDQRARRLEHEIIERHQVEQALRQSEAKYRHIINAAADAIISLDEQGRVCEFNHAAEEMFGIAKEDIIGHPLTPIIPPHLRDRHTAGLQHYLATGQRRLPHWYNIELPGWKRDGGEFPLEISFSLLEAGEQKFLTGVLREITERKRVEDELRQAREHAESATLAKSAFLANMSHELRTPMNAIIGFTRLVMRRTQDILPQRQYENLERILVSAEHLLNLINDILDLSKIEAGHMDLHPVCFPLAPLIDACLQTMGPIVQSKPIQFVKEVDPTLPLLYTDQIKVQQILVNLLSNAVKFTASGTVTIRARYQDEQLTIAVSDTGIGIPAEVLAHIFTEFRQVDSSSTRQYGGTGLGLSISRRLAQLLGGDITVQSVVGAGSTFTFTLPLRDDSTTTAINLDVIPLPPERPDPRAPDKIILAIDDDPDVVYLLQENLAESGYSVIGATSGKEGLERARVLRPFAITLDILMPHKDGWQTLYELKSEVATRDIPIIVLSIVDNKALGYRLGACDYLLKPFSRDMILAALMRVPAPRHRLLVVDDDPQIIDMVRQFLDGEPYEVVAAADGRAALDAIAQQQPDIILLDLLMPRLDGFEVIEYLRQETPYRPLPIIVLTAKTLTPTERAVLDQSVRTVIQKRGLDRDLLITELKGLLSVCSPLTQATPTDTTASEE